MRILPAASRLTTIVLLRLSSNTESRPAVGEKLALIAIVMVPFDGLAAAQTRVGGERARWGTFAPSRMFSRQPHDRLEGVLRTILFFCGDTLMIPECGMVPPSA